MLRLYFQPQDLPGQEPSPDPPSGSRDHRRWGGIFTPEYHDEYAGEASAHSPTWRAALRIVRPKFDNRQRNSPTQETSVVSPNLRRASLTRSNAVCNRRSRASKLGVESLLELHNEAGTADRGCREKPEPSSSGLDACQQLRLLLEEPVPVPYDRSSATADDKKGPFTALDKPNTTCTSVDRLLIRERLEYTQAQAEAACRRASLLESDMLAAISRLREKVEKVTEATRKQEALARQLLEANASLQDTFVEDSITAVAEKAFETSRSEIHDLQKRIEWHQSHFTKTSTAGPEDVSCDYTEMLSPLLDDFRSTNAIRPTESLDSERKEAFREYLSQVGQASKFMSSVGGVTPRGVLLLKFLHQISGSVTSNTGQLEAVKSGLDVSLGLDTAIKLSRSLSTTSIQNTTVKMCAVCRIPKFINAPFPSSSSSTGLSEFHPDLGTTTCCSKAICRACLPTSFVSRITTDWWHNLGQQTWLKCPIPTCHSPLPIRYNVDLTEMLRSLGDPQALHHVMQFDRANLLRAALECLPTQLSGRALLKAAQLHGQLAQHGRMRGFFELRNMISLKIELLPVDTLEGDTLDVPVFTGLFLRRRKSTKCQTKEPQPAAMPFSRDCIVCAESIVDVVDGTAEDEARWAEATTGFPGEWQLKVRSFPPPSVVPECGEKHEMDICRECIARHLETQLETLGRAACDRLSCPAPSCGHVYTDREARLLASRDTYAKLDKFRLLNHLATLPNFRWCLREGCASGQMYDMAETAPWSLGVDASANHVSCEACGFDMCFAHQEAWHFGLSCAARDAQKAHGDPDIDATKQWIVDHTKPCPGQGCGVPVEKKGGCFHMTCSTCRFEFCWECLADWKKIQKGGGGTRRYDRKGHNVGCYFRGTNAEQPTMLMGNAIEEALARY